MAGGEAGLAENAWDPIFIADLFDPEAPAGQQWTPLATAKQKRLYHSGVILLDTGHVVTTGSEMDNYEDYHPIAKPACAMKARTLANSAGCKDPFNYNIERFTPPYLQLAATLGRPVIQNAPDTVTYGSLIAVNVTKASNIGRVTFIRYSTSTHSTNTDQRFVELVVEARTQTTLYIRIPSNPNIGIPGNWFLWVLDLNNIPSVAKTVKLGPGAKTEVEVPKDTITLAKDEKGSILKDKDGNAVVTKSSTESLSTYFGASFAAILAFLSI